MRFYDFPNDKLAEYKRRIEHVKEKNPDTYYPSETPRKLLCYAMYLGQDKDAVNMAAQLGDTSLCRYLHLENPDIINAKYSEDGNTPLLNAVQRKRLGTAEWFLQHGAKILPNKEGWNPVLWACAQGCIPALNMFKHYGVDFNQPYPIWRRGRFLPKKIFRHPIDFAIVCKQSKVFQWLLDNGVSIDQERAGNRPSVRELFAQKPELFTPEMRDVLVHKALDKAQKTVATVAADQKHSQKGFWARLGLCKTKA